MLSHNLCSNLALQKEAPIYIDRSTNNILSSQCRFLKKKTNAMMKRNILFIISYNDSISKLDMKVIFLMLNHQGALNSDHLFQ